MKTEQAKSILSAKINEAEERWSNDDFVLFRQILRDISDLPLPSAYIEAALKSSHAPMMRYY